MLLLPAEAHPQDDPGTLTACSSSGLAQEAQPAAGTVELLYWQGQSLLWSAACSVGLLWRLLRLAGDRVGAVTTTDTHRSMITDIIILRRKYSPDAAGKSTVLCKSVSVTYEILIMRHQHQPYAAHNLLMPYLRCCVTFALFNLAFDASPSFDVRTVRWQQRAQGVRGC